MNIKDMISLAKSRKEAYVENMIHKIITLLKSDDGWLYTMRNKKWGAHKTLYVWNDSHNLAIYRSFFGYTIEISNVYGNVLVEFGTHMFKYPELYAEIIERWDYIKNKTKLSKINKKLDKLKRANEIIDAQRELGKT